MNAASPVMLVNPNTDSVATESMLRIARSHAGNAFALEGMTASRGVAMIVDEETLAMAARDTAALAPQLRQVRGVIVGAFGDPGICSLRASLDVPVRGIGESSLLAAAANGRRFCIATSTPRLAAAIDRRVAELGLSANYAGVMLTAGDPLLLREHPRRLVDELAAAIERAAADGVEVVVIGGGPLSDAAEALAGRTSVAIVQPIVAAIQAIHEALGTSLS